jgi:D-lactate dehydrogenase (cytochrome)
MGLDSRLRSALTELSELLGDRLSTSRAALEEHGRDESPLPPAAPDAVVWPRSTEEVSRIVAICARERVPVIPFGAGTSLEGHVLATSGGVCMDLSRMNEILRVGVDDLDVTVEAGVTRNALNERLARDGLFFPVDPGANATIGGMTATGASGTTTVRYGAMRENVLAVKVVLPDARVVTTSRRARKSSAGYDLTRLFVGSEGTLGVITEVTLRVHGLPEAVAGAVCHFPDVASAIRTAIATLQTGVPVARIEFVDELGIKAINEHSGLSYPVAPLLLLEFHGSPAGVVEQAHAVGQIAADLGAIDYRTAVDASERAALWRARHDSFYASLGLRPGSKAITTDVCVPISRLAECIVATRDDIDAHDLTATMVGHVGDGNFHVMMLIDPDGTGELARAEALNRRLVERALALDGTCTGEHGIGLHKLAFLPQELPEGVEVMRALKRALDPRGIMNPGKVLDDVTAGDGESST